MGILLLIITGLIYGLVGTVILHFINNIFALFGEPTILEQPFILDFCKIQFTDTQLCRIWHLGGTFLFSRHHLIPIATGAGLVFKI